MKQSATENDLIENIVCEVMQAHEGQLRAVIGASADLCESPIERVFVAALCARNLTEAHNHAHIYGSNYEGDRLADFDGIHVYPQAKVDGYRLDFLFVEQCGAEKNITVIELDGHDFHERTKAQAAHDKSRDRHFAEKNWAVVRFTGSEVWRDPMECVNQALVIAQRLGPYIP